MSTLLCPKKSVPLPRAEGEGDERGSRCLIPNSLLCQAQGPELSWQHPPVLIIVLRNRFGDYAHFPSKGTNTSRGDMACPKQHEILRGARLKNRGPLGSSSRLSTDAAHPKDPDVTHIASALILLRLPLPCLALPKPSAKTEQRPGLGSEQLLAKGGVESFVLWLLDGSMPLEFRGSGCCSVYN